jgi:hypothetical protein
MCRLALCLVFLLSVGCVHEDRAPRTETRIVELQKASEVAVDLEMPAGELRVKGGARELLEAKFRTASKMPDLRYQVTGSRGRLQVTQRHTNSVSSGNEWELRLNGDTPIEIDVKLGAGVNDLDLSEINLRGLDVRMGAGKLDLDLRGSYDKSLSANIRGGVGDAVIRLPKRIGVTATVVGGIGGVTARGLESDGSRTWTNAAYKSADVRIRLDVQGGVGHVSLLADN